MKGKKELKKPIIIVSEQIKMFGAMSGGTKPVFKTQCGKLTKSAAKLINSPAEKPSKSLPLELPNQIPVTIIMINCVWVI